jgi:hypothetical protein
VLETERAKPRVLANMLTMASGAITRRLAPQPGQRLAAAAHRRPGLPPMAGAASGRVSAAD